MGLFRLLFEGFYCAAVQTIPRADCWADAVAVMDSLAEAPHQSPVRFGTGTGKSTHSKQLIAPELFLCFGERMLQHEPRV